MKQMGQVMVSTRERWESTIRGATAAGYMKGTPGVDYETMKAFVDSGEYSVELAREHHIKLELETFDSILPCLFHRKWLLLQAPAKSSGFITSDHPSCLIWDKPMQGVFPPGLGLRHTELLFPISRELAAVGNVRGC